MRTPAGVRQRAQPVRQRSLRRCPQGERSESIPLSPPQILKKSLNESPHSLFIFLDGKQETFLWDCKKITNHVLTYRINTPIF